MNTNVSQFGRVIGVLSGIALLSAGLIGCQTTDRDFESSWSAGVGGSAAVTSENLGNGYGPHGYIRKRISDHFKIEGQGTFTRHNSVEYVEDSGEDGEIDSTFSSLTLQYEFMPSDQSDVRLFVGGGGGYTIFSNENEGEGSPVSNVDVENTGAGLAQVGLKVPWGLHITASRLIEYKPEVEGTMGGAEFSEEYDDQDVWLFSAGFNIPF